MISLPFNCNETMITCIRCLYNPFIPECNGRSSHA